MHVHVHGRLLKNLTELVHLTDQFLNIKMLHFCCGELPMSYRTTLSYYKSILIIPCYKNVRTFFLSITELVPMYCIVFDTCI